MEIKPVNYIRYINKMDTCSTHGQFSDKINHISFRFRWYVDISATNRQPGWSI